LRKKNKNNFKKIGEKKYFKNKKLVKIQQKFARKNFVKKIRKILKSKN